MDGMPACQNGGTSVAPWFVCYKLKQSVHFIDAFKRFIQWVREQFSLSFLF
jgi:hypothetical protein